MRNSEKNYYIKLEKKSKKLINKKLPKFNKKTKKKLVIYYFKKSENCLFIILQKIKNFLNLIKKTNKKTIYLLFCKKQV